MSRKLGGEVVREGFLIKSPPLDKPLSQRRKRYFVLWSNAVLEYYSSSEKRPQDYLKTIDLSHCEDMVAPISSQGRENVIKLSIVHADKTRDYFLEADDRPDMEEWVKLFAQVCGFCPVEEITDYPVPNLSSSPTSTPHLEQQGLRKDLQIRAPIRTASPGSTPQPVPSFPGSSPTPPVQPFPGKRAPLPPPKPKPKPLNVTADVAMDEPQPEYVVPGSPDGMGDSTYFTLSPTGQHVPEDGPHAAYEEMEYDEEELNRNPPPVWKPPARKYTRSMERGSTADFSSIKANPPAQPLSKKNPPPKKPPRPQVQVPSEGSVRPVPKSRTGGGKGPPPPVKPKPMSPPPSDALINVLNDPNLRGKLLERKQELYADTEATRLSVSSWDGPDPLENYEEVCFDSQSNIDDTSHVFTRSGDCRITLPPRRHNDGSVAAMLQCPPKEDASPTTPQAYLKFQRSRSPSPQDVVEQWSNGDSHSRRTSLTPPVRQKSVKANTVRSSPPPLPSRDPQKNKKSPHLVRKPLPPAREVQAGVTAPRRSLHKGKSHSEDDLLSEKHVHGHSKPRPSSSVEAPPPLPSRVITSDRNTAGPRPLSRRDLDLPMPLPGQQRPADHDGPPPVPLRHPNASGAVRTNHCTSVPGSVEASVQRSITGPASDNAPPVPARGRDGPSPDPALQRPFNTSAVGTETKKRPRPPMKPPNVDKPTPPTQTWDSRLIEGEQKAPISRPRPPVSTKPAKKPQVTPKPVHLQRTFPVSAQNGETPPPLPPR